MQHDKLYHQWRDKNSESGTKLATGIIEVLSYQVDNIIGTRLATVKAAAHVQFNLSISQQVISITDQFNSQILINRLHPKISLALNQLHGTSTATLPTVCSVD